MARSGTARHGTAEGDPDPILEYRGVTIWPVFVGCAQGRSRTYFTLEPPGSEKKLSDTIFSTVDLPSRGVDPYGDHLGALKAAIDAGDLIPPGEDSYTYQPPPVGDDSGGS